MTESLFWRVTVSLFGLIAPLLLSAATLDILSDDAAATQNVRAWLRDSDLLADGQLVDAPLQRDGVERRVRAALEPYGYYTPELTWTDTSLVVKPGQPVTIRRLDVRWDAPLDIDFDPPNIELRPGDPLKHERYAAAKRTILSRLYDLGFLDARLAEASVVVDPENAGADIEITVAPGIRYRFGALNYKDQSLEPRLMRRFVPFSAGEPFSYAKLLELNRRLRDSRYFGHIDIEPHIVPGAADVDIDVALEFARANQFEIGVGIGSDSGFGLETDYFRPLLGPGGSRLEARASLAQRRSILGATIEVPSGSDIESRYRLSAYVGRDETDSFDSDSARIGVSRLRPWRGWRRTDTISILHERSDIGNDITNSTLLIPEWQLRRQHPDDVAVPESGYRALIAVRGAAAGLLSDASFLQLEAEGKWIHTFATDWRLLVRGRVGWTTTDDFDELPATLRFFAGGDRSIRGYAFQSLGPLDEDGDVIGGKGVLEASWEIERRVTGPWRAAAFVDAGNAGNNRDFDPVAGAGIGVRYSLPVGSLRVDVAWPLDDEDPSPRLHVVFGPDL